MQSELSTANSKNRVTYSYLLVKILLVRDSNEKNIGPVKLMRAGAIHIRKENMTKIGFIIHGYKGKSHYWNGNVKPFVDLSYGLKIIGEEPVLFIDKAQEHLKEKINSITQADVPLVYFTESNLENLILENDVKYLIVEDDLELMKNVLMFQTKDLKLGVFVQYLYGVNTNKQHKRAGSIALTVGSYLPWRFVIMKYRNLIRKFDFIIANSQACGYLLRHFYDVSPAGIVYPPVGVDMKSILSVRNINDKKNGLLIFAGNIENDYFLRDIFAEIIDFKHRMSEPVRVFVSNPDTAATFSKEGIEVYSNVTVEELVSLYSKSKFTYVPTAYELFGYVGAESLLCGTPVILDTYHPFLELVPMNTNAVRIAHSKSKISDIAKDMNDEAINMKTATEYIDTLYSAEESAKSLLRILDLCSLSK